MNKILFIAHQSDMRGGASKSMISIITKLVCEYGDDVCVIVPAKGELTDELNKANINFICAKYYWWMDHVSKSGLVSKLKWKIKKIINQVTVFSLFFKLKFRGFNIVYTNTSTVGIGFDLAKKLDVPHVFHIREFGESDHGIWYLDDFDRVKEKILRSTNTIVTISNSLQQFYFELLMAGNFKLVYNGIDPSGIISKVHNENDGVIRFISVGYLCPGKNQHSVLAAVSKLVEQNVYNFKVIFVGDGEYEYVESLKRFITSNNLERYVELLGSKKTEEVYILLSNADVGIMSSKMEAFGRVTVEYMLAELPVIASNSGANPEIIVNNVSGLLYRPDDIDALSLNMKRLINSETLRKNIGSNAKERAIKFYTVEAAASKVHDVICNAIKNHP